MRRCPFLVVAALVVAALVVAACAGPQPTPRPTAPAPSASAAVSLAVVNGRLVDGSGGQPVPNAVVLISGDRIVAAGPAESIAVPAGTRTIDARGGAILPGFINAHVHRGFDETRLRAWAQAGVTTVRDEDASRSQVAGLESMRERIAADPRLARLVSSGTMLAVPGGYGELFVSSPEEARAAVLDEIDDGVDGVKVALEDGYAGTTGLPKLTPEELRAIVETAHAHGLPVSGHLTVAAFLQPLLDAGVDDVAHVPYDAASPDALRQMADRGVYLTPTFTVFRNYGAPLDGCVANLRQFVALGGKVALGNDYGGGPGAFEPGIPMYELEMMASAGMTPMQLIEASTRNAAHVAGLEKELGTLAAGKVADVLVVAGDPLTDLHALESIRFVVHGGMVIREE